MTHGEPSFCMLRRCSVCSLATLLLSKVLERQHSCRREATLQVLHGRVRLSAGDSSWEGRTGTVLKATLTQTGEGGLGGDQRNSHPVVPEASQVAVLYASRRWRRPAGKGCGPVTPSHRIRDPTTIRWVSLEELGCRWRRRSTAAIAATSSGTVPQHPPTAVAPSSYHAAAPGSVGSGSFGAPASRAGVPRRAEVRVGDERCVWQPSPDPPEQPGNEPRRCAVHADAQHRLARGAARVAASAIGVPSLMRSSSRQLNVIHARASGRASSRRTIASVSTIDGIVSTASRSGSAPSRTSSRGSWKATSSSVACRSVRRIRSVGEHGTRTARPTRRRAVSGLPPRAPRPPPGRARRSGGAAPPDPGGRSRAGRTLRKKPGSWHRSRRRLRLEVRAVCPADRVRVVEEEPRADQSSSVRSAPRRSSSEARPPSITRSCRNRR